MPVPSAITDLSQTAGSNSPAGSESPALLDDYIRTVFAFIAKLRDGQGLSAPVDLASAATTDIGAQTSPIVRITGTTTITSFGANYAGPRFLTFAGALTLTHNATSLILPGGANITTAAGDACIAVPNLATPSGWRVVMYQKASVAPGSIVGLSGVLPTTQGGSGSNYADVAALFAGIKQAATETATGVVELATAAEAPDRTKTAVVITPATLRDALNAQNDPPILAARGYLNLNASSGTPVIRASSNVASITDNGGAGDFTVNLSVAMPNANYVVAHTVKGSDSTARQVLFVNVFSKTTTSFRVLVHSTTPTATDPEILDLVWFG